jgi:hypothetical protein
MPRAAARATVAIRVEPLTAAASVTSRCRRARSRPISRYDASSNLSWQVNASSDGVDWKPALDKCAELTLCGHSDWRLPSISELRTLIRGCSMTQAGGACRVSDSCLASSCDDDGNCNSCSGTGPGRRRFLPGTAGERQLWVHVVVVECERQFGRSVDCVLSRRLGRLDQQSGFEPSGGLGPGALRAQRPLTAKKSAACISPARSAPLCGGHAVQRRGRAQRTYIFASSA